MMSGNSQRQEVYQAVREAYCLDEAPFNPQTELVRKGYTYWKSMCHGNRFPARTDIDPTEVPTLLSGITLVDVEAGKDAPRFRFRLMGDFPVIIAGGNHTGAYFDELPALREDPFSVIDVYMRVLEKRQPHYWRRDFVNPHKSFRQYESLVCPLSGDGENIDMFISFLSPIS